MVVPAYRSADKAISERGQFGNEAIGRSVAQRAASRRDLPYNRLQRRVRR